jgi:hypothetical protein
MKPLTVVRAQALCTTAAVLGGKSLASQISEKIVGIRPLHDPISHTVYLLSVKSPITNLMYALL